MHIYNLRTFACRGFNRLLPQSHNLKGVRKAITTTLHNHTESLIRSSASDLYCHNRNEKLLLCHCGKYRERNVTQFPGLHLASVVCTQSAENWVDLGTRPWCNNNRTMNYDDINSLENSNINISWSQPADLAKIPFANEPYNKALICLNSVRNRFVFRNMGWICLHRNRQDSVIHVWL